MKHKKISQVYTEIDHETKEIKKQTKTYSLKREPDFVKMYVKDVCKLFDLKKNAYEVLIKSLYFLDYDGDITLTSLHRNKIAKEIGITDRTVKNQLALLTQKKILKRKSNMVYAANPNLFAKGDWASINNRIDQFELIVEYKSNKRTVKGRSVHKKPELKAVD